MEHRPRNSRLLQTRRRFLAGLAILGVTPACSMFQPRSLAVVPGRFTGDDFELGHRLLFRPQDILDRSTPEVHAELYDVLVVGGGVSGLVAAYRLRDQRVLLLERDQEAGGVSKSETWQGIDYALGAAYIIDPDPKSEDARERAGFELLEALDLRKRGEDLERDRSLQRRLSGDASHCVFTNRRVLSENEVYSARNRRFFEHVLDSEAYPSVPPNDPSLVEALDRISFHRFLTNTALQRKIYGRSAGSISRAGWEALEYYCWGAFGTGAAETSAYHGLNFFCAEFGQVLVFPGGNGLITKRLQERIPSGTIRTGAWVLRIEREGDCFRTVAWENGKLQQFRARAIIFAAPLFLAPAIIPSIPEGQRKAIGTLEYRSYVVANVLLRRSVEQIFTHPAFRNGYELTRGHEIDIRASNAERISNSKVFSDAIFADFAVKRAPAHSVLTVYRPYPYRSGRDDLMASDWEEIEMEVRREILAGFGVHGLRADDIEAIRLTRWGHPMIVTRPGQLADGTIRIASRSQPGLYFAHTDVQGAPAYENAVAAADDAVEAVTKYLSLRRPVKS